MIEKIAEEPSPVMKNTTDIISNAKILAKQQAHKVMLDKKRELLENNKVDCYTPKKMKHRIFTYERIKHKKEQKKQAKEKR